MLSFYIALGTFIFAILLLLVRRKGKLLVPMWAVFIVGSIIVLASGLVTPLQALYSIDPQVMIFLFSMVSISRGVEMSGDREAFSSWLIKKARSAYQLSLFLSVGVGLAASVSRNDS